MCKLSSRWVPRLLTTENKKKRMCSALTFCCAMNTVHQTHNTTAREFLLRSFVAQLKNELRYAFRTHCTFSRAVPCLLTGNALPTELVDFQFLQCVQYLKNNFISFRSLVLEYGGRDLIFETSFVSIN